MDTAFLFPGQGAQRPEMLHELVDDPAVQLTLDEISDVLRSDVRLLDSPEALNSTVSVQLALLASGVATARALQRRGVTCCAVAGLSVGAFAAAVVVEAITLKDAAILVRSRAEKMEQLYPVGHGLAAIVGLSERQVTTIVDSVHTAATPVFVLVYSEPTARMGPNACAMDPVPRHSNFILPSRVCHLSSCRDVKYQSAITGMIDTHAESLFVREAQGRDVILHHA